MKNKFQLKSSGFYIPSFFYINIETDDEFINMFNSTNEPTLIHEYIHFLQDVSTIYGLTNTCNMIDYIIALYQEVHLNSNAILINRPIEIVNFQNVITNTSLFNIYQGSDDYIEEAYLKNAYFKIHEEKIANPSYPQPVSKILISFYDLSNDSHLLDYEFGSIAILESMSFLIEKSIFGTDLKYHLPYKIAEQIVSNLYPEFGEKLSNIIILCDASLMFLNPGEFFFNNLLSMKIDNYLPSSDLDLYSHLLEKIKFVSPHLTGNKEVNYQDLYQISFDLAIKRINELFKSEIIRPVADWIIGILKRSMDIRMSNIDFISQIAYSG